ncbi:MAG TPA: hypothetical protein VGC41_25415 [Kofleriaceae bacterium]
MKGFVAILICAIAPVAAAESPKQRAADAAKLFEEGRDAAKVANYKEACDKFARSYDLDPADGTAVNFADCQEHLGHLAVAWQLWQHAAATKDNPVRAQYARDRAAALEPRLGTVIVRLADHDFDDITLSLGDRKVTPGGEVHERVDPGDIELVAHTPHRHYEQTVHVGAGASTTIEVPLLGGTASEMHRSHRFVLGAIVTGGAGVASLVVGGVFAVSASRYYSQAFTNGECYRAPSGDVCSPAGLQRVDDAHSRGNLATGFAIVGTALVATGIGLYLFAPNEVEVAPTATATSAGVSLGGKF